MNSREKKFILCYLIAFKKAYNIINIKLKIRILMPFF